MEGKKLADLDPEKDEKFMPFSVSKNELYQEFLGLEVAFSGVNYPQRLTLLVNMLQMAIDPPEILLVD